MKINAEDLLDRYQKGECSPSELAWIESWYLELKTKPHGLNGPELESALLNIGSRLPLQAIVPRKVSFWARTAIAASLFLTIAFGYYFLVDKVRQDKSATSQLATQIPPGGNKAVLTLASGEKIVLDAMAEGKLADQAGNTIRKTAQGLIRYDAQQLPKHRGSEKTVYNTMRTPLGGQFQLILSDGTRVWLNAGSSIRYPAAFSGDLREVYTTGEVYFEVSKNKQKPFRVHSGEQLVEVLGTHFNINAYADEAQISTTLLEGSVKISSGGKSRRRAARDKRSEREWRRRAQCAGFADAVPQPPSHYRPCRRVAIAGHLSMAGNCRGGRSDWLWSSHH